MMAGGNVPPLDDFEIGTESAVGRILLAGTNEYNHFLMKGTVLVVEQDENGAKGLLLDKQTAFLMGEMVPQFRGSVFRDNKLFTGGEQGPNSIVVLHARPDLPGARPVGGCGLALGGAQAAEEAVEHDGADPAGFKFLFNFVGFQPGQLEQQVAAGQWDVLVPGPGHVPYLLCQEHNDGMWSQLRNRLAALRSMSNKLDQ